MKKLMTMIAAVATAFGLFADDAVENKTDFSALTAGEPLNVLADDSGQTGTGLTRFWTYTSATPADDALLIKNDTAESPDAKDNYLAFKTGSETLYRNFNAQSSSSVDPTTSPEAMDIPAEGLYSDTTIKFGAAADELAVVADANFLASVIDETEAAEGIDALTGKATNLWVIGGYQGDSFVNRAFRMEIHKNNGDVDPIDEEWLAANKRVVIKAYEDVGNGIPGFILYVGDNFATVKGWAPVLENGSIDYSGYTAVTAADYLGGTITQTYRYGLKQLLLPMTSSLTALTAVGFKGTGALDSIALGGVPEDLVEEFTDAVQMTVNVADGFTAATYQIGEKTAVPLIAGLNTIEFAPGADITVTAVYPTGKIVKWTLGEDDVTEDVVGNAYTIEDAIGGEVLKITASEAGAYAKTSSGDVIACASIADALAVEGVVEVALAKDATLEEALSISAAETITIDLAGNKIEGETTDALISLTEGNIIITDSVGDGEIAPAEGTGAILAYDGSVTFTPVDNKAFYVKGSVAVADECTAIFNVNGGFFSEKIEGAKLPEGKKWVKSGDYWTVGDVTYVAQIGDDKYESLKDAVDAANKGGVAATIEVFANTPEAMVMTNEVALTITVAEGKTVTLDPTIPANATYPFVVKANLTLNGTGTWLKTGGSASMFRVLAGKVTVTSGTFIGGNEAEPGEAGPSSIIQAAAENTEIEVNGGTFKNFRTNSGRCVRADNTNTLVTVNGGSFYSGATGTVSADNLPVTANFGTSADNVKKHGGTVVIPGLVNEQPNEATFNMDETQFCAEGYKTKIVAPATDYSVVAIQYATLEVTGDEQVDNIVVTNALGETIVAGQFDIDDAVVAAFKDATFDANYELDAEKSTLTAGPMTTAGQTYTINIAAKSASPWPTPDPVKPEPEAVAEAMKGAGFSDAAAAAIGTKANYTAFQAYCTAQSIIPTEVGAAKDNAVLTFALGADACTEEITSEDVTIAAFADGKLTVAIDGVTAGEIKSDVLAKVLTVKGNDELAEFDTDNVNVTGYASAKGDVEVTVAPDETFDNPAAFFYQIEIKK